MTSLATDGADTSTAPSDSRSDEGHWATPVAKLRVAVVPDGAINLNVAGRRVAGPLQGFGQLWHKTYRVRVAGGTATPSQVIATWKANFGQFWPAGNRFYVPLTGMAPGEVALINLTPLPGPVTLSTGIMVIYADDESFTFMNPEGHMFAGWITFSAFDDGEGTVCQIQLLIRSSDPAWEVVMRLFAFKKEDEFWCHTLSSLARHLGVQDPVVDMHAVCVDRRVQWSQAGNVWRNAAMWSGLYTMAAPLRWLATPLRSRLAAAEHS